MKWTLLDNSEQSSSWALNEESTIAELKFSKDSKTVRLFSTDIRQFFLEASGKYQQRVIMTSEYGILLGELQYFKQSQNGILFLNQNKYYFTEEDNGFLVRDIMNRPIGDCKIEPITDLNLFELASLLFGCVWVYQSIGMTKASFTTEKSFS